MYVLEYPGICIPRDNRFQFEAYFTGQHYNWHPILHTLLTNFLVFTIGRGSLLPYMLLQIAALAAVVTYALYWINLRAADRLRLWGSLLWFTLHPVFAYMAFTLTKDVLFSACLLLLSIELAEFVLRKDAGRGEIILHDCLLGIAALGVLALRNNGILVVLALLPAALLLIRERHQKLRLAGVLSAALIVFLLGQAVLFRALRVEQPPVTEALAIPLQQFGRVIKEGRPLTEEEAAFLDAILPLEQWETLYRPVSVDPVKFAEDFYGGALVGNPARFLRVWLGLLRRYPADFILAALDETRMLWNPLVKTDMVLSYHSTDEYPFQIPSPPFPALTARMRGIVDYLAGSPLFRVFWSPAALFLASAVLGVLLLLRRQRERLLPLIPCWVLWFSLLLTLPAGLLGRYVYGVFLCMPAFFAMLGRRNYNAYPQRNNPLDNTSPAPAAADRG